MQTIHVSKEGDFRTIGEALLAVPYRESARIQIAEGVYHEKIFCEKKDITLTGAGSDKTIITWSEGGRQTHCDGRNIGTFRSYTAFFGGEKVRVENLSIVNAVGDGRVAGQGIAAYIDSERTFFSKVHLTACQDTLFCAPLPEKEYQPGGFFGPRAFSPRVKSIQFYEDCRIEGDVDFIFGGGDAVFDRCELVSRNRGEKINGYVAGPSGFSEDLGFVFRDCSFTSKDCADGTVFLGRPWRPQGKTALLRCDLGAHIHPDGWDPWGKPADEVQAAFAEYRCTGPGADRRKRVPWAKELRDEEASALENWIATRSSQ